MLFSRTVRIFFMIPDGSCRYSSMMATEALQPRRSAPASIMARASSSVRMPPDALIFMDGPVTLFMSFTASTVAPGPLNPVDVLTKSAPEQLCQNACGAYFLFGEEPCFQNDF